MMIIERIILGCFGFVLVVLLVQCNDNTPTVTYVPQSEWPINDSVKPEQDSGIDAEDVLLGAGAIAAGAAMGHYLSKPKELEKCDWDDHPNEPECRGTAKHKKWLEDQRKAKAKARKSSYKTKPRKVK